MCSRSWINGSSSDALKSGEKWVAHIITANITQATIGWARNRTTREWRNGMSQRRRVSPELRRRTRVTGAARARSGAATSISRTCWTMWTEKRLVSYRSMPEISANASASIPPRKATVRRRGTGLRGWTESTRRTAHSHQTTVAAMREGRDRLPGPPEQQGRGGRRFGGNGSVGEDRADRDGCREQPTQPRNGRSDRLSSGHRRDGPTNGRRGRLDFTAHLVLSARDDRAPGRMAAVRPWAVERAC